MKKVLFLTLTAALCAPAFALNLTEAMGKYEAKITAAAERVEGAKQQASAKAKQTKPVCAYCGQEITNAHQHCAAQGYNNLCITAEHQLAYLMGKINFLNTSLDKLPSQYPATSIHYKRNFAALQEQLVKAKKDVVDFLGREKVIDILYHSHKNDTGLSLEQLEDYFAAGKPLVAANSAPRNLTPKQIDEMYHK